MKKSFATLVLAVLFSTGIASAQSTFDANLLGTSENPPNASPGTGFGQVVLNAAQTQITCDENWSGLTSGATASHIHSPAPAGMNAPVLFPLSGVPNATAGAIPTQSFAITPSQVSDLMNGLMYMNV